MKSLTVHTASPSAPSLSGSVSSTSARVTPGKGAAKKWAVITIVALVCAGGIWGRGFSRGRASLASQRAQYEERLNRAGVSVVKTRTQLKQIQDELAQARYRARLLEARSLLLLVAVDLERRNFGTANTRLRSAATELKNLPTSDSANSALSALQRQVSSTNLVVVADVEQQRRRVLEFGERLERLTPLAAPEAL